MSAGAPPVTDPALQREIEAFVFLEARLADTSRYGEWEALVDDDMTYHVPAGPVPDGVDPADHLSYINDNRARLATRIRQLQTGKRHAQTPVSTMARSLSNVEVLDAGGGQYVVHATQVVYELAVQSSARLQVWPGRVTYRLRRSADDSLRMAAKTVQLVTAGEPLPNLTFLL
ncbi:MAG: aromatic-ring-hydroxylating dioxygenase subunit beta [Acidimicrobiia bacterium]